MCKLNDNNTNSNTTNINNWKNMYGDAIMMSFLQSQCFVCSVSVCLSAYFQAIILHGIYQILSEVQFRT